MYLIEYGVLQHEILIFVKTLFSLNRKLTKQSTKHHLNCESVANMISERSASPCSYLDVMLSVTEEDKNPFTVSSEGGRPLRNAYLGYVWMKWKTIGQFRTF